ncbi:hypothetical protein ACFSMW_06605 [Virgibacillus halophilus]|uniref:DUF3168 domain-containing protein n=1 Tax=Tigheibacillus halophilus TaxID=361280 RepID=A0ABU5C637_9BACI|nr:hypothetical protein [Virgibacillus halophilus]
MPIDLKSPQQQIFDAVYAASLKLGYATFDYLPANKVAYPFVFVGEQSDQDRRNKSIIYGDVQQTVHIYHNYKKRRELTTMMDKLKVSCRSLKRTENFYVTCKNITAQTITDDSTADPLLHGILEVEFTFN